MQPNAFPRRILLMVTGMSPQVVTETLYALYQEQDFIPTELRIITTEKGRVQVVHGLLGHPDSLQPGYFHLFCRDYGLTGKIAFSEAHITLIKDAAGKPLPDIRTPTENQYAADCIVQSVKSLCADPNTALHVSIAGGRKTMGFFIGYALSLFARAQDRLSHVLVSAPFENHPQFYYPSPTSRIIANEHGVEWDAADAQVMLADIPLVRLRDGLPEDLLLGKAGYSQTVHIAQRTVRTLSIEVDTQKRQISCGGTSLALSDTLYCVYLLLIQLRVENRPLTFSDTFCVSRFIQIYSKSFGENSGRFQPAVDSVSSATDSNLRAQYFRPHLSKINTVLKRILGSQHATPYLIQSQGKRNHVSHTLSIAADLIHISGSRLS